jgi:hypothetical protein
MTIIEKARRDAEPIPKSIPAQDATEFKPSHPKKQDLAPKRRFDRSQFLSAAEIEARYGFGIDALQRQMPDFPRPIHVAAKPEQFFSRAGILCFELEQRCKRGRAAQ